MNRKLKHGMSMAVAILSALFINTACTDEWDKHYGSDSISGVTGSNSGQTSILDKIREDNSLQDFCEILDSMNISDKKGKLVNFADSLFNQSRVYTLWAPIDGTYDKEIWLEMLKGEIDDKGNMKKPNRDKVMTRFVGSHVAEYIKNASGVLKEDNFIYLINKKMIPFASGNDEIAYTFNGIPLTEMNIRASNGLIHKIEGSVGYAPSIWEYIETAEGVDEAAKWLYSFNKREFNKGLSIEGPTENGDKTYLDSVFTNSNQWLTLHGDKTMAGFGDISKEDSSYVVFFPSNNVWNTMVPHIEEYFTYHTEKTSKMSETDYLYNKAINDSLKAFYARKSLLNYIVFSNNDQPTPGKGHTTEAVRDSLFSTYKGAKRLLFAKRDLMDGVIATAELSNGTYHLKDNFNYNRFNLWHDTIKVEAENGYYQGVAFGKETPEDFATYGDNKGAQWKFVSKDELHPSIVGKIREKNLQYIQLKGSSNTSTQYLRWTIPEVLSGDYYVGVVVVPEHVASKDTLAHLSSKKNMLTLTLSANQSDDGKAASAKKLKDAAKVENDPTRIDTVWVGKNGEREKITFKYSEYGLPREKWSVYLEVKNVVPRNTNKINYDETYDRVLRVDLIILEPVDKEVE